MPIATTRHVQARQGDGPRPMNVRSLQMMVSSGVVRRADWNPSLAQARRELAVRAGTDKPQPQDESLMRGWLVRLLVRRKSTVSQ